MFTPAQFHLLQDNDVTLDDVMKALTTNEAGAKIAAALADAESVTVERTYCAPVSVDGPLRSSTNADCTAWTISYTWWSNYRGSEQTTRYTILQTTMGGLSGGDGWATAQQHIVRGVLSDQEISVLANLIASERLPKSLGFTEL